MKQLKVTANNLPQMCRLCLASDTSETDIFLFSSDLGKKIADVIMECVPVQITRHDKKPTCICRLCFTQLKEFHQFQMQAVRSDRTLQCNLQQLSDCHAQSNVEPGLEEQTVNSISQDYIADVTTKCEPFEISDQPKQEVVTNVGSVNKLNDDISIKLEIKDEPTDDNYLIPAQCADTVETPSIYDGSEISYVNPMFEFCDTKAGNVMLPIKLENDLMEKIPMEKVETYIPSKQGDGSVCPEIIGNVECLRSNEDNVNRTEHLTKRLKSQDSRNVSLTKSATSTGEKLYQCDICEMCFIESKSLKNHKLIHTGEKLYKCDVCQMHFKDMSNLKKHSLTHTGEKPYQCDICKMCFTQRASLKGHTFIHTGEKPYQCDICKKGFRKTSDLKNHKLTHTGDKPYQCDICKMCFTHRTSLKGHKFTHTGEKPYQCDVCEMCFRQPNHLKSHKLIHTGEKPYECDICKKCFIKSNNLKTHKLTHIGDKL